MISLCPKDSFTTSLVILMQAQLPEICSMFGPPDHHSGLPIYSYFRSPRPRFRYLHLALCLRDTAPAAVPGLSLPRATPTLGSFPIVIRLPSKPRSTYLSFFLRKVLWEKAHVICHSSVFSEEGEKCLILSGSLEKRKFYLWNNASGLARGSAEPIRSLSEVLPNTLNPIGPTFSGHFH